MKKVVLLLIIAVCLLLTGCGKKDVGIIGGADGPTSIYVSE